MRSDLDVLAEMLGANSTAALSFNDGPVAAEIPPRCAPSGTS